MKHALLGTTALVAAGLMVGEAYALELGIGGRYYGAYGSHFGTQDDNPGNVEDLDLDRGDAVKQDVEVFFLGETVLDNGLTVGARVELEGQTQADQIDQVFGYICGGFGELRIGETAEALAQLCYIAPSATVVAGHGMFTADSPIFTFNNAGVAGFNGTNGTCYGLDGHATKLVYFSPSFGGFHFAASYAPDGTESTTNFLDGFGTRSDSDSPFQDSETWSLAGTFAQDFNGVSVVLGGGATFSQDLEGDGIAFDSAGLSKREEYNAYAQVGFGLGDGTLTIGGAWAYRSNLREFTTAVVGGVSGIVTAATADDDDQVISAGIAYGLDAWTVGASASWGTYESACPGAGGCDDDLTQYVVDADYALGPGVNVAAAVGYDDYDPGNGDTAEEYSTFWAGMGIYIGF